MTLQEFKAWFEGFSEGIDKVPSAKQWERIKERTAQITGESGIPYPVYVRDRPYYERLGWPYSYLSVQNMQAVSQVVPLNSTFASRPEGARAGMTSQLGGASAQSLLGEGKRVSPSPEMQLLASFKALGYAELNNIEVTA